jgi:hypothetical protein
MYINDNLVTVGATNTVAGLVAVINAAAITGVTARTVSGKLALYADSTASNDGSTLTNNGLIAIEPGPTSGAALLTALGLVSDEYPAPEYLASYSYQVPRWGSTQTSPRPTGSVWQNISAANSGLFVSLKTYSATLGTFVSQSVPAYQTETAALYALDPTGGGRNIPVGTTYILPNSDFYQSSPLTTFSFTILERAVLGQTVITGTTTPGPTAFTVGNTFTLVASQPGTTTNASALVTIGGTGSPADFITAVSAANIPYAVASVNTAGNIVLTHTAGGSFGLRNVVGTPLNAAGISTTTDFVRQDFLSASVGALLGSNFVTDPQFDYTASSTEPDQDPATGRLWYYSTVSEVDIMIQDDGAWKGYQTVSNNIRGFDLTLTNATGPIIAASAPTTQSDGTSELVNGDLWVDTSDLENYPKLYRWEGVNGIQQWVEIDTADQVTEFGILFADARWSATGTADPVADPYPSIESLLVSNYVDLDAPDPSLYPQGMLLFNTRRSGYNVKSFQGDYFNTDSTSYSVDVYSSSTTYAVNSFVVSNGIIYVCTATTTGNAPPNTAYWSVINTNTWLTASGNKDNGSMWSGRLAQRQLIVAAMKSGIDTSIAAREEQNQFNIIATPAYPELTVNMIALSNERNNTLFVVADTPMRLPNDGNSLVAWATNNNGAGLTTEDGNNATSNYAGAFYPSCQTTDLSGNTVVQPPSHMMVRTILRSDAVSYPWFAPAGTRRGVVDNATSIGYIDAATGEFQQIGVSQAVRDILYERNINPITFIPGVGITNFGNKTTTVTTTALDRINVARLVAFLRGRLEEIGKLYLFEPNDVLTRNEVTSTVNSLMIDLVSKRAIYDYLVVCDDSNNTPARIDRNELWVDIAIEPVKAVEFIYIPLRIKNTGEISGAAA